MRRWLTTFAAFTTLLLGLALSAQSTSSVRGSFSGVVFDTTGSVLPNIDVTITGPQGTYSSKTDVAGHFLVRDLVPGSYTVKIAATGFKTYVSEKNLIVAGATSSLDIHLQVGAVTDTITVEAGAVQIDTANTALSTPLTDQLYQSLPLPRNVSGIFALAPGVVSGGGTDTKNNGTNPSIGGASGLENLYLVDGVNVTDQAFGGFGTYNRYWGALGTGVNLAFIKEVDIKTSAFEPQYGKAAGGIVEIVTKSGSTGYHGAIAAYAGPGAWYASRHQQCMLGYTTIAQVCMYSSPQYDMSGELGGYVPFLGLKDKMFFFGAFDPAVSQDIRGAQPGQSLYGKTYTESLNERSWAGKISYQASTNTQIEASSFGDPSFSNSLLFSYSSPNAANVSGRYDFGNINSVLRVNHNITPSWIVNASYTYNMAHFNYLPGFDNYTIQDRTASPYITYYVGGYEPTKNADYAINLDTQKVVNFLGQHTLSVGYTYEHTNFLDQPLRTGALYSIPSTNLLGKGISFGSHPDAAGKMTNATFRLYTAVNSPDDQGNVTASTTCAYCAKYNGKQVYLQVIRGTWAGLKVNATSRYHVLWGNDSWQMGRHINLGLGLRWEEQWYGGSVMNYLFNDNWSPRLGINWDPKGDHKTKLFLNWARYQSVLPLDAAIRQLGNEQDDTTYYFAPKTDSNGNMLLDANGAPIVVPDAAHTLNGTQKGVDPTGTVGSNSVSFGQPTFSSSTGEGILPGTRMEYENEYVFGLQRQIAPGMMLGVRYSDRRLGRVIEDIGSQSPEGSMVDPAYGGGIANVSAGSDYFVNEQLTSYTPSQWNSVNSDSPGAFLNMKNTKPYVAPAPGCTYQVLLDKKGNPYVYTNDTTISNGGFFQNYSGANYNGACVVNATAGAANAGDTGADGKADGFADPSRKYQEFVVEFARNMKNNWQARANFRYARLWGNYEGFFRNDNGQSDPGISSLFDFTTGVLGLLGDQFKPGLLNTDRRMVANISVSYLLNDKTPFLSGVKGLNIGMNVRGMSGSPLSAYASHPIYLNTGEIPIGGRGTKGTLPSRRQLDLHADYPLKLRESMTMKFSFDGFNVTNSQLLRDKMQNLDTSPGVSNPDYGKDYRYNPPFYARASVKFEF